LIACVACSSESKPKAAPPPVVTVVADAAVIDAPPRVAPTGTPPSALVLDLAPTTKIFATPTGAVKVGPDEATATPVDLVTLAARLGKKKLPKPAPGSFAERIDGTLWVRVDEMTPRPVLVVDYALPAIRVFEIATAARPHGLAIEVIDPSGARRAFAFRSMEPTDRDLESDDSIPIDIERERVSLGNSELPLTANARELAAVVAAEWPEKKPRWGILDLKGARQPIGLVIAAMEAATVAGVTHVTFLAGKPRVPHFDIVANPIMRRHLRRWGPEVGECHEAFLREHPRYGHVTLTFTVVGDIAKQPKIVQTDLDEAFRTCLERLYHDFEIPGQSASDAVATIYFEPDGGDKE
jgi:hypothetical protein